MRDLGNGAVEHLTPGGVFVFIGMEPNTQFLKGTVDLDRWGFILTGATLESNLKGLFACGDARAGSTKQVASAAGEGATAALMAREYVKGLIQATASGRPAEGADRRARRTAGVRPRYRNPGWDPERGGDLLSEYRLEWPCGGPSISRPFSREVMSSYSYVNTDAALGALARAIGSRDHFSRHRCPLPTGLLPDPPPNVPAFDAR